MNFVRRVACNDAGEFLDTISPRGPLFIGKESAGSTRGLIDVVIYRGHSDSKDKLVPSVLRYDGPLKFFVHDLPSTQINQVLKEVELLARFFHLADFAGLPLPEDSQALRKHIARLTRFNYVDALEEGEVAWPPDELLSLLAIGQHYGLPTRLLDWTRSHLTAAYFAVSGARAKCLQLWGPTDLSSRDGFLTVWAFDYSRYVFERRYQFNIPDETQALSPPTVELVTTPHAGNPNLHAQDGLFTLFRPKLLKLDSPIDRRSLAKQLQNTLPQKPSEPIFYEITLPYTQVDHLMWLLSKEGINASRFYPAYDGVVKTLREEGI